MKLEHIIYDIRTLMSQSNEDSRLNDSFLIYKINEYRAMLIRKEYLDTREINPIWLQNVGLKYFTCVGTGDDQSVKGETTRLGKCTLSAVVSLPRNLGMYRVSASSKQKQIYPTSEHEFFMMLDSQDRRLSMFEFYFMTGKQMFIYPYREQGTASCILENPLEAQGKQTEIVQNGNLQNGVEYLVTQNSIVYGKKLILVGQTFIASTASGNSYNGDGQLFLVNKSYDLDTRDDYPCDSAMAEQIIIEVLTKDFHIESQFIADLRQDFADHTKVIKALVGGRK